MAERIRKTLKNVSRIKSDENSLLKNTTNLYWFSLNNVSINRR